MAKRKAPGPSVVRSSESLYREIRSVLESARAAAYRAVNAAMVQAYWQVGRLVVEDEQGGEARAAYGEAVLDDLSQRLTADFGKGFPATNLKYMRSFYLAFPIRHAPRDESAAAEKVNAPRSEFAIYHPSLDQAPAPAQCLPTALRPEALMIEPAETESKEAMDALIEAVRSIAREAVNDHALVWMCPTPPGWGASTSRRRPASPGCAVGSYGERTSSDFPDHPG
ncbi:MAG: DUF1016 N-terminal domain-containing protein [Dehalococcoidia bacterium]|nr:DUF1016 N-terminal domain-containing protein [Dehalococcoidia bacterium]